MSNGFLYVISGAERFFRETYIPLRRSDATTPGAGALVWDAVPASMPQLASCFERLLLNRSRRAARKSFAPSPVTSNVPACTRTRHTIYCFLAPTTISWRMFPATLRCARVFDIAMALAPADITPRARWKGADRTAHPTTWRDLSKIRDARRLFERALLSQEKASSTSRTSRVRTRQR